MTINADKALRTIAAGLDEVGARCEDEASLARVAGAVSGWSVGQQLHHTVIVAQSVASAVRTLLTGRGEEGGQASDAAAAILESGEIPRGTAQAPTPMLPGDSPDAGTVRAALEKADSRWADLDDQAAAIEASTLRLPHPVLGPLTAAEWTRLGAIHTQHHLRIVDEILAAGN